MTARYTSPSRTSSHPPLASVSPDVAQGVVEDEAGDDDLEALGLDRLVGSDDVERQLTRRQLRFGQGVRQHVTVLAAHRLVRVADADLRLESPVVDEDVGGRVWRAGRHLRRRAEVVGDDASVAVTIGVPEVLIDDLSDPQSLLADRLHSDLLGLEALAAIPGADDAEPGEPRARDDDDDDEGVAPGGSLAEHDPQSAPCATGLLRTRAKCPRRRPAPGRWRSGW